MLKRNRYFLLFLATVVVGCGIEPGEKKNSRPSAIDSDIEYFESHKDSRPPEAPSLSLREAYLDYVYPVLREHCTGCHIHTEGTHPFAGNDVDDAVAAAGRLIGTQLSDSRFYVKVANESAPHPNAEIANAALPSIKPALEEFFAKVASAADGIVTDNMLLADSTQDWPRVNLNGWLIFEAEGGDIAPDTKFRTQLGVFSNGTAVGSNAVANHPVSGTPRTYQNVNYSNDACSDATVRIDQLSHVDGGLGIARYVLNVNARVLGKSEVAGQDDEPLVIQNAAININNIIRILPYNRDPRDSVSDSEYKSFQNPSFNTGNCTFQLEDADSCIVGTQNDPNSAYGVQLGEIGEIGEIFFREEQIDHLIARFKDMRNNINDNQVWQFDKYLFGSPSWCSNAFDGSGNVKGEYNATWVNRLCTPYINPADALSSVLQNNKAAIFRYLQLSSAQRAVGQQTIAYRSYNNDGGERLYRIRSDNGFDTNAIGFSPRNQFGGRLGSNTFTRALHQNQTNIDLSWFTPEQRQPGVISFAFSVPKDLHFEDLEDNGLIPFRQYYRGSGSFRVRIEKLSDGSFIDVTGNNNCPTFNSGQAWSHRSQPINLERGEDYRIDFLQINEASVVDAFILVADTELNEHLVADPNTNPHVLRQKFYGAGGLGSQEKTNYLSWDLDFGRFQVEVIDREGFYIIENPKFFVDSSSQGQNVAVNGLTFRINNNVALADRNYNLDAVRIPGHNIAFGQVLIPKQNGFDKDKLAVIFSQLELTSAIGTLPDYREGPPLEGAYCMQPDVFREWLWPVYSQQRIVIRQDYESWKNQNYPARYTAGNVDNDPSVQLPNLPTVYTCTTCHDINHPYMQLNASDYLESCDLIIARTNLARPELSFSLRGLRGQFNHIPMYTIFNPWNGSNLNRYPVSDDDQRIYGPMNGAFGSYSRSQVDSLSGVGPLERYRRLTMPSQIGFQTDPEFDIPLYRDGSFVYSQIGPGDSLYNRNNFSTWYRSNNDDMLNQHNATIDRWIEQGFKRWVEAEREARR